MVANEGGCIPAVMNVTPANGEYNNGGMWGGDWASWIILFLIFGIFGGAGFGGFGGGFGGGYATESILQRQLDTQTIVSKLDGISQGLCDGFYAMSNAVNGLGMTMQQGFNAQNVTYLQGQNALQTQIAGCCCGLERAIDGVNYNMATQSCATNTLIQGGVRDIVDNANSNTRAILDYLCNEKIQGLRDENQALRLAASQSRQDALLRATIDAQTAEILRRTGNECPQPAYIVQPPQPVGFNLNCAGQATFAGSQCNPCGGCNNGWNG